MTERAALTAADLPHLERARELARRGWGRTFTNPLVGCVIVGADGAVAEGHHALFGGPHAEIVALEAARGRAEGATVYVSLEPCNHHAKTPPCSEALIGAGVRRVVYGARDPGSESGGGAARLREAGIEVVGPVWSQREARAENPIFFHLARHESPFVALKLAISLDGCIAARPGERTRLTGCEAEREVHRLRAGHDAVMVGAGTVRTDDPLLTPRLAEPGPGMPRRIVLDSEGSLPSDAALFRDRERAPVHVFVREEVSEAALERLEAAGAHVHPVHRAQAGLALDQVLQACWDLGIRSILCEGGGRVAESLLREGRVHRLYLFIAPRALGAGGLRAFPADAGSLAWDAFEPALAPSLHGPDTLLVLDRQEG
ncbi:MAG TPA: bifunctional diaminohydroxyphosphoribosylaminopyrimidine deaminase/5-amino-6-(5-phosphoribosylamino)uracil reductase RibD [Longimicrobiales bacterium]|nr:bifunctional diaminohydroxyphosphoribosylaminopyrimidine deaminase/5-amino-6-(5-phosphoribosylamino)uracil reductase RibD [Longimicrobiales bacterium]